MKIAGIRISLFVLATMFGMAALTYAQTPPDFSKIEIKTTKITDNFYTLEGQGGTIGVLAGPDGVFLVDTQFAPLTGKIVAAVKQISPNPIRFVVNTHVHGDHTGGNENLGKMGAVIFAREELRSRLMNPAPAANGTPVPPAPAVALPVVTYRGRVTFHMDGEEAELIPIQRAHTDGDTLVYFHGANVDRAAMIAHRDMILGVRDHVAKLVKQGKSPEDVLAAHPTSDFDAKVPMVTGSSDRFVGQLYAELKPAK